MRVDIITIFPEVFNFITEVGVIGKSHKKNIWDLHTWNLRDFSDNNSKSIDDKPYGGTPGMLMQAIPLERAIRSIQYDRNSNNLSECPIIFMTPSGEKFNQVHAEELSSSNGFIIICGRYEGIDKRIIDMFVSHEFSIGDFIMSGGEIAALALIDTVVRLLPGTIRNNESIKNESFSISNSGLLEPYGYTRPAIFHDLSVPEVLMNGNHKNIALWNRTKSLEITLLRRPELIDKARNNGLLSNSDEKIILDLLSKN